MSVPAKGNSLPKMGKQLPISRRRLFAIYSAEVAKALKVELGGSSGAIKTVMRWTGASERTAKGWLAGTSGPRGDHLIALIGNSDVVFERVVLRLSGRSPGMENGQMQELRSALARAISVVDAFIDSHPDQS